MYDDVDLTAVAEKLSPRPPSGSEETFARMIADLEAEEFTQVPTALILGWTTLGLKPIDLQVVLAVRTFWRPKNNVPPYPSIQTLADMIGVSRSTVQRSLGRMVEKGYLRKGNVPGYRVGTMPRTLDFSGLWNAAEKGCQA